MDEVALRLASSGAELASALEEPTALPDSFTEQDLLALNSVVQAAADVDTYVSKPGTSLDQCRQALQSLYRLVADGLEAQASSQNANSVSHAPQNKLVTTNFHVEQIWGQLDVLTEVAMKRARKGVKSSKEGIQLLDPSMEEAVDELIARANGLPVEKGSSGSSDSKDNAGDLGGEVDDVRDLSGIDYDLMLQSGHKKPKGKGRPSDPSDDDTSHEDEVIDAGDDKDDEEDDVNVEPVSQSTDEQGVSVQGEQEEEGLLPVEDDFLRLDDMEAFVQHAEAAHAAGDTGGFDTFQEHLEGNELGGSVPAKSKKRARDSDLGEESNSDSEDRGGSEGGFGEEGESEDDVDLYTAFDSDGEEDGGQHGVGRNANMSYEEFFGRKQPYGAQKRRKGAATQAGNRSDDNTERDDDNDSDHEGVHESGEEQSDGEEDDNNALVAVPSKSKSKAPKGILKHKSALAEQEKGQEGGEVLSTHEKRQLRMAREIEKVEAELIADKAWQFRGEATAKHRPKDSALEIDLDFDRTMRPPPQPTLEAAAKLEDIIKQRILELRFDNVVRVNVEAPERAKAKTKAQVELQDNKAKEGLADEYAKEYHATVAGVAEDRHAKLRSEVKNLYAQLAAKLDALSHLSLTPKPIVTDLEVVRDMPAIAMEEAAPVATSLAAMQAPEEAHAKVKDRALKAEDEKTQSDRHAARAAKKRVSKRKKLQAEEAQGVWAHEKGIKSAREDAQAAREAAEMNRKGSKKFKSAKNGASGKPVAPKTNIATNSSAVFKVLEAAKSKDGLGGSAGGKKGEEQKSAKFMY